MAIQSNFPAIKPSLVLDFANTKQLDPRITYTRASTATFYNGVTTAKAEENLLLYSQEFDNAAWSKLNVSITANTTTAPDGTVTADTLTATAGTSAFQLYGGALGSLNGFQVVESFFVKAGTHNFVQLQISSQVTDFANFDLSTGTAGTTGGTITSSITSVGNGWYRITLGATLGGTNRAAQLGIVNSNSATRAQAFTAAGTETVFIWGAQLEQRSSVSSYTATTTQAITNYIPALQTAASGVARFDHNPTTGESLGLLIEDSRTNLILQSEDFSTTWIPTRAFITTNTIVSPSGTLTGDKLYENTTASNTHYVAQSVSLTSGTTYTSTVYAKAGERTIIRFRTTGTGTWSDAYFNLSNGTVFSGTGTITSVGNGWYRCSISGTSDLTGLNNFLVQLTDGSGSASYTGDGYSGVYIWGAQIEVGAFATSYIPTVASQVTRSADAASMTGTNFSSWYSPAEGSFYVEMKTNWGASVTAPLTAAVLYGQDANIRFNYISSGVSGINCFDGTTAGTLTTNVINIPTKIATAFSSTSNTAQAALNGTINSSRTFTKTGIASSISIGNFSGLASINGTIKKVAYYPLAVTNAQLQALTS